MWNGQVPVTKVTTESRDITQSNIISNSNLTKWACSPIVFSILSRNVISDTSPGRKHSSSWWPKIKTKHSIWKHHAMKFLSIPFRILCVHWNKIEHLIIYYSTWQWTQLLYNSWKCWNIYARNINKIIDRDWVNTHSYFSCYWCATTRVSNYRYQIWGFSN